ncbi:DUF3656 domain-containing U32 family peptidase [Amedibacillus sp. YH-ame6]
MKRVELLAPAGSFEALQAAVQNGCDALYLGGVMFGARAFANNFDEEEMKRAVAYAHVYGVRVFVTVNTMIKEEEIEACLTYIKQLQDADVDALIIQDLGLFQLIRAHFPDFELHASTQMHIHNPQGIHLLQELGAARVVVPRETSIEEIQQYSKLGMDLEVFVQGALCISYSGQCLMSAMTQQRSGNRGECAQSCRMQYDLERIDDTGVHSVKANGKYLLSPKDLNSIKQVPALIEAGIASFKIEGRMKRPEYVALMVSTYRKAIDAYYEGKVFHVDATIEEDMQKIFHRGFSAGHLFHKMGSDLMNFNRPNHMGIEIGKVIDFRKDKVSIQLSKPLYQGDGIRILSLKNDEGFRINRIYKNGLLVNHGDGKDIIEIDKTFFVEKGSVVVKTSDVKQLKQLQETYEGGKRRVPVYGSFKAFCEQFAQLEVMDELGNQVIVESTIPCVKANHTPLDEERLDAQLRKSKDTPFDFLQIEFHMDHTCILPIKEINQMRRDALSQLEEQRKVCNPNRQVGTTGQPTNLNKQEKLPEVLVVVHTMEQYLACKEANMPMIFVDGDTLYQKLRDEKGVYPRTSRVMKKEYPKTSLCMIQESGGLYQQHDCICDTSLNVANHAYARFLFERHAFGVCFSLELSLEECIQIVQQYEDNYQEKGNFIYPIYGRIELMISEYCCINAVEKDSDKKNCGLCRKANYQLSDLKKQTYPIMCDEDCRMHILQETPRNYMQDCQNAKQQGISSFLCVFTNETKQECEDILNLLQKECSL